MGATAQRYVFGPFFLNGALVTSPHIFHYVAGTTTLKDGWSDRGKLSTVAQPFVGDANGIASFFLDGLYKIVVKNAAETDTLYTWDNFEVAEPELRLEGTTTWNPGTLLPGQSELSPEITVTGAVAGQLVQVSAPYDLQGILATAYVSAADTVKILLHRPLSMLMGSTTWNPGALRPGQSELSAGITVTGAALGDGVIVYPPYDLQGFTVTGHVSAANTVKVKLVRNLDMLRGTATIDPANLADGAGATFAAITVTGAAVGDAVIVYPPYDMEDTLYVGYVQAANTVEIRHQNESTGARDLASGTWEVAVIPRGSDIDLASGTWQVGVVPKATAIDLASGSWAVRVLT